MEILKVELLLYRIDVFKNIIKKLLNQKAAELIFKKYNLWLWEHFPMSTNSKVVLHRLKLMKTHFLFFFLNFVSMSAFIIFHEKAKGNWYPQCRSSLSLPSQGKLFLACITFTNNGYQFRNPTATYWRCWKWIENDTYLVGKSTPVARQAVVKHLVTQMIHFF